MAATPATFAKKKDYLICVDSDGCAIDTMDIKHHTCFGPCMVEEWGLQQWAQPILARWNDINLYTMTRGINRFKGLAMALAEIDKQYTHIEGLPDLLAWVDSGAAPSNDAVEQAFKQTENPIVAKALRVQSRQQSHRGPTGRVEESFPQRGRGLAGGPRRRRRGGGVQRQPGRRGGGVGPAWPVGFC